MPISVKATFAQEGVFFAGERLNCTITFTNSSSSAPSASANGLLGSTLPSKPPSTLQQKLQILQEHQPQQQFGSNGNGAHAQPPAAPKHSVDTLANNSNRTPAENGARTRLQSEIPQQRPSAPANRSLSQPRVSSDISHIDAISREQAEVNGKASQQQEQQRQQQQHQESKLGAAEGQQDGQEEHDQEQEQTIAAPPRGDDDPSSQSPAAPTLRQQQLMQQQQAETYARQDESQQTISSPGLLGLASFMYRSASFSSLASAFGLSGGEQEPAMPPYDEKKLPPLPPPEYADANTRNAPTVLPPMKIMSPDNEQEKTTKESSKESLDLINGHRPAESNVDPEQLARMGTPLGLGLGGMRRPGHARSETEGSTAGLTENMIELQVADNHTDTQSIVDDGEYQTPRPSMDYSTRSSMQSTRGPFQSQYYREMPTRRSSLMSNYSTHSSPRSLFNHGSQAKKESLLWGSVQVVGQFMVDGSFIRQQGFESLKTKTMYRPTGSAGGGAIGGGTLGAVSSADWRDRANANRLFPVFSTPPSILFVDLQLAPGESTSYTYQIELPTDLPPSHRGKTIRFSYNLVLGVQRGSVHTPAKSVQLPFRLYNHISELGTRPVYDLMSPVIYHKDTAISGIVGQGRVNEKPSENSKSARKQFEDYVDELIRNIASNNDEISPGHARELTRRESDAYKDEEAVHSHTCLEKVALLSRSASSASYDICKNNVPVAKLSLIKTRFKLGETVHGVISFTTREIPTYQISVTLETTEAIEPNFSCRSAAQTAKLTKRVHAELHESCIDTMRTSFSLCIPPTATPEFKTSTLSLKWYLRVEFITGPANQPRFKMTSVDERRSQYHAVESLATESFDCSVPIQVYPTSYETGALFSPTMSFNLA